MSDGDDLVGELVTDGTRIGRIVVASRLLDIALLENLGPDGQPNGVKSMLKTLKNLRKATIQ